VKLLLDENLPVDLRHDVAGHDVFTVSYMGWTGVKNGRLLALAAAAGFDAIVTADLSMEDQQNLKTLPGAIVVLHAPSTALPDLRALVPKLLADLTSLAPRSVTHVRP
jgi:hypothetical protein